MRNEKGLTLIELLAAITISTIVLGVSFSLFASMTQVSNNSTQQYSDSTTINRTMDTVSKQISASSQITYFSSNKELRYKMGKLYKSLYYEATSNNVTLYDFSNDGDSSNDATHFMNSAINKTSNSRLYTSPMVLSTIVSAVSYKQSDGTTDIPATPPLSAGNLVKITMSFSTTIYKVFGGSTTKLVNKTATVKLLFDTTPNN